MQKNKTLALSEPPTREPSTPNAPGNPRITPSSRRASPAGAVPRKKRRSPQHPHSPAAHTAPNHPDAACATPLPIHANGPVAPTPRRPRAASSRTSGRRRSYGLHKPNQTAHHLPPRAAHRPPAPCLTRPEAALSPQDPHSPEAQSPHCPNKGDRAPQGRSPGMPRAPPHPATDASDAG